MKNVVIVAVFTTVALFTCAACTTQSSTSGTQTLQGWFGANGVAQGDVETTCGEFIHSPRMTWADGFEDANNALPAEKRVTPDQFDAFMTSKCAAIEREWETRVQQGSSTLSAFEASKVEQLRSTTSSESIHLACGYQIGLSPQERYEEWQAQGYSMTWEQNQNVWMRLCLDTKQA